MKHPLQIDIVENETMKHIDVVVYVGAFNSKEEAQEFAEKIIAYLGADVQRLQ